MNSNTVKNMTELIPENRCSHCNGTGYDPVMVEEIVYTKNGDIDVQYSPVLCRLCEGSCKEVLSEEN